MDTDEAFKYVGEIKPFEQLDVPEHITCLRDRLVEKCDSATLRDALYMAFDIGYTLGRNEPVDEDD